MIVFAQNLVTTETAALIANIALLSGHIGAPRDGILQLKPKNNSQGLVDMGIKAGAEALAGVKVLLVFGENPGVDIEGIEFLMVSDTHLTEFAKKADVVFPASGFICTDGTFTNTERRMQEVAAVIDESVIVTNWELAAELAHVYEADFGFEGTYDISVEMDDLVPRYKYGEIGEILGGVLVPDNPKFVAVSDGAFAEKLACTDNLMNVTLRRLPRPVK
jgi:formate dehydrogenase major subunit